MSVIANNLPKFENDIQSYENVCKNLQTHYACVVKNMIDLNAMWRGESYEALIKTFNEDMKAAQGVMDFLEEMKGKLYTADNEYSDCEKRVRRLINDINIG